MMIHNRVRCDDSSANILVGNYARSNDRTPHFCSSFAKRKEEEGERAEDKTEGRKEGKKKGRLPLITWQEK